MLLSAPRTFALLLALFSFASIAGAQKCAAEPAIQSFGSGTSGEQGVPELLSEGAPLVGFPHSFRIRSGAASATGVVFFSAAETAVPLPGFDATFYPGQPFYHRTFELDEQGDSDGVLAQASVLPSLCGVTCTTQGAVLDPLAPGGAAFTAGLNVTYAPPSAGAPVIEPVDCPTALQEVFVLGQGVQPGNTIRIEGSANGVDEVVLDQNGMFAALVPLLQDNVHTFFVREVFPGGVVGPAATFPVAQDSTPPKIAITFPADGEVLSVATTDVAGTVADTLSGYLDLAVTVNGQPANVNVGIGTNGSFDLAGLALPPGVPLVITATARDAVGNSASDQITVLHQPPTGGTVTVVSGESQDGTIRTELPDPIVVRTVKANGTPLAGKPVTFKVTKSDGRLAATIGGAGALSVTVVSDAQGEARAFWTLGSDAGMGNNRVRVTASTLQGAATFCASATPDVAAAKLNVGMGNNQVIQAGTVTPMPLRVWVNDGQNGLAGVPVEFKVASGDGTLLTEDGIEGGSTLLVPTELTGHAEVLLRAGDEGGVERVEVAIAGSGDLPVAFITRSVAPELSATRYVGLVLDNSMQPIEGASVELHFDSGAHVVGSPTAADGTFALKGFSESGKAELFIDGATATSVGGVPIDPAALAFPYLEFEVFVVEKGDNELGSPVLLPRLDPTSSVVFDGTEEVVVTLDGVPGFEVRVPVGTQVTKLDGTLVGPDNPITLSLNQVHLDEIPMPMPDGANPPFAWTFQPSGALFDPPLPVEIPNMGGLAPGAVMYFLAFDHDTMRFEIVGNGSVTDDGAMVVSAEGQGLVKAGWGGACPPYTGVGDVTDQCVADGDDNEGCCSKVPAAVANKAAAFNSMQAARDSLQAARQAIDEGTDLWNLMTASGAAAKAAANVVSSAACVTLGKFTGGVACLGAVASAVSSFGSKTSDAYNLYDTSGVKFADAIIKLNDARGSLLNARDALEAVESLGCVLQSPANKISDVIELIDFEITKIDDVFQTTTAYGELRFSTLESMDSLLEQMFVANTVLCTLFENYQCPILPGSFDLAPDDPVLDAMALVVPLADAHLANASAGEELGQQLLDEVDDLEASVKDVDDYLNEESGYVVAGGVSSVLAGGFGGFYAEGIPTQSPDPCPVKVSGVVQTPDGPRYGVSPFYFAVPLDGVAEIAPLEFVATPPITTKSIQASVDTPVLTSVGQTTQVDVTAFFSDGTQQEVQGFGDGVCYTTSNPVILRVDGNGVASVPIFAETLGGGGGPAFITVRKDGTATAVSISVALSDPLTSVEGLIVDADMLPVAGADVVTSAGFQTTSNDPDGSFQIANHSTETNPLRVDASATLEGGSLAFGFSFENPLAIAGTTEVGTIVIDVDGDGDGLPGWYETELYGTNPLLADTDGDGLSDGDEVLVHGTSPTLADSDGDGFDDALELELGSGPLAYDPQTIVVGTAELPDGGGPAAGATVTILDATPGLYETATDVSGFFSFLDPWPATLSPITLQVSGNIPGEGVFAGTSAPTETVPGGETFVGPIVLGQMSGGPLFDAPTFYPIFNPVFSMAVGHLDGDDTLDFVVSSFNAVSVVLGGESGFSPATSLPVSSTPEQVRLADLNADGALDIVTANGNTTDDVSVVLGGGDGTWADAVHYPAGNWPEALDIGDLDGNGTLDIAVGNINVNPGTVSILSGLGDGTFSAPQGVTAGLSLQAIEFADLDLDGSLDIVAVSGVGEVDVLLGEGGGTFEPFVAYPTGTSPRDVAVADLDGDGALDLAVANENSDDVSLFFGDGAGGFGTAQFVDVGNDPAVVVVTDLDGDGLVDLAVANEDSDDVSILLGEGGGLFASALSVPVSDRPRDLVVVDLGGDGLDDLMVGNASSPGKVTIVDGKGDGTFAVPPVFASGLGLVAQDLEAGDLNDDGALDLAFLSHAQIFGNPGSLVLLTGLGDGTFPTVDPFPVGASPFFLEFGDVDGDGALDAVSVNGNAFVGPGDVSVLLGTGDGSFLPALSVSAGTNPDGLALGDLDGNGTLDIVTAENFFPPAVYVLLGLGGGGFAPPTTLTPPGFANEMAVADLNSDGALDLAVPVELGFSDPGELTVYLGNGNGTFGDGIGHPVGNLPTSVSAGDLDADGVLDLVVANALSDDLSLLMGVGDGTFLEELRLSVLDNPAKPVLADLDQDGNLDLVVAGGVAGGDLAVLMGQGDGTFAPPLLYVAGSAGNVIAADVDGDGDLDLATAQGGDGGVLVLENLLIQ